MLSSPTFLRDEKGLQPNCDPDLIPIEAFGRVMDLLAFPFAGCCVEPGTTYRRTKLCRSVLAYVFFVHIL